MKRGLFCKEWASFLGELSPEELFFNLFCIPKVAVVLRKSSSVSVVYRKCRLSLKVLATLKYKGIVISISRATY